MPVRRRLAALAVLALSLAAPAAASAAAGDLDPAWDDDGVGRYAVDDVDGGPVDAAVAGLPLADGATLLVVNLREPLEGGGSAARMGFLRLRTDGTPDTAYGPAGVRLLPAAAGTTAADAVLTADGDVVVVGNGIGRTVGGGAGFAVSRFAADAAPDTTFGGGDGIVDVGYGAFREPDRTNYSAEGTEVAREGTSKLVLASQLVAFEDPFQSFTYLRQSGIARLDLASGDADLTFGDGGGTVATPPAGFQSFGTTYDLASEPTGGKVLLLGEVLAGGDAVVAAYRFDEDGSPDASFGQDGATVVRLGAEPLDQAQVYEQGGAILPLPGGDVAVAGGKGFEDPTREVAALARLTSAGAPVTTFGTGGVVLAGPTSTEGFRRFRALELIDGELYAAGTDQPDFVSSQASLARFTDMGLDTTFSGDGVAVGGAMSFVADLAAAPDGFAVVTGTVQSSSDSDAAAARFDLQASRQPVLVAGPAVEGPGSSTEVAAGEVVSSTAAAWRYGGAVTRQWQVCATARAAQAPAVLGDCAAIEGATGATLTGRAADRGKHLRLVETNTNGTFTATAASATIFVDREPPAFTTDPSVTPSGTVPAGTVVRATWQQQGTGPITPAVRWFHCPTATTGPCQPVPSDDTADDEYTTSAADVGSFLRAIVELSAPGGGFASKQTTNATGVVAAGAGAGAPVATAAPTTSPAGPVVEGTVLERTSDGTWDQDGLTFARRWQRCTSGGGSPAGCATIPGATGTSYATTAADAGRHVRLVVDARNGDGPVGTAASTTTEVTAKPAPVVQEPPQAPAAPVVVRADTTTTKPMPDVRGLPVDQARARVEAAGIFTTVDVVETVRTTPAKLRGKVLDVGDVSAQSLSPGTQVRSSIGEPRPLRLVVEAGRRATAANGGPSGPVCTGPDIRADLKGLGLGETFELLRSKRCSRLDVDFVVSPAATEIEVRQAVKDGKVLELRVVVPAASRHLDLTPIFRQGSFTSDPSFGRDDWALTAGTDNIMGLQVVNRANRTVTGAEVLMDLSKVGAKDVRGLATGGIFARGLRPTKAGTVNVLVQQEDARGNRIFGFGRFKVVKRTGAFTTIDGRRYEADGDPAPAVARAAGFLDLLGAIGKLASDLGGAVQRAFSGPVSATTITAAAKQRSGLVHLSLGNVLSGSYGVVAPGGANVVAAGGANVVAAGGANAVAAGGANAVSVANAGVVAAGGANAIGKDTVANGTGQLIPIPAQVVAAGGANVVSAGGGNVIAPGGANVVAAGGANMIAIGGAGVVAAGGGN